MKLRLWCVLCLTLLALSSRAEERENRFHVHTNPILDFTLGLTLELDVGVLDNTWSVGANLWDYSLDYHVIHLESSGVGFRLNKHFGGTAGSSSWYIGGGLYNYRLGGRLFDMDELSGNYWGATVGGSAGYQIVAGPLAIRIGGGYSPITPYLDFTVGGVF